MFKLRRKWWSLWDGTRYTWETRQKMYTFLYVAGAAAFAYSGMYVESLLALVLAELRISRVENYPSR